MQRNSRLLAAVLLGSTAFASPASAESLVEALSAAYNNNPTLMAARSALRATDESVPQALAGWRPTVQVSADAGKSRVWSERPGVFGTPAKTTETLMPRGVNVSLSQPIYTGGRIDAALLSAEHQVLAGRADLVSTEQQVLLSAATQYMNVLRDQATLELNVKNVQVLQRQLEAAQDRFRVGEITKTDVAQAEARSARAIADRVRAEGDLQASRAAYQAAVGHMPENLKRPDLRTPMPENLQKAVTLAGDENPRVIALRFAARAAEAAVDQITGELLPQLALRAGYTKSIDQSSLETEIDAVEATLNLTVPIYQAGSVYSRAREQKHIANQRRIQVHEARRTAIQEATAAWETWMAARARIQSYFKQIEAGEIALEGVEREAQVGSRTVLDVLDAEQELLDSRVNLVVAQRDEQVAAFLVVQATGRLTALGLELPVPVYDPTEHYMQTRDRWFGTHTDLVPEME